MEEEIPEARVTRSLRKRLNSTDREGSPVISSSKNGGPTPVKSASQLVAISEHDLTSDSEDTGAKKTPRVVRTRARVSSTLTEANVQLHSSPARRLTRRNSGAMEPSTPTPRRSTRASSITSDDVSVNSNVATKRRRSIYIDNILKEEDEKYNTSPMSTRSTSKSPVQVKNSPINNAITTHEKQKASPPPSTPTKQVITEIPTTSQQKDIAAAPPSSNKIASSDKINFLPSLKISKIDLTEYSDTTIINDEKIDVDDSIHSNTSHVASNENANDSKQLEPPSVIATKENSEVLNILEETIEGTPVTKQSRSVSFESISNKSSPAPIYPKTPKPARTTLDLEPDDKSYETQTPTKPKAKQPELQTAENESDNKSVGTENDESSSQLSPRTPTKKSLESDVNKSVTINVISQQLLDSKTPTKNVDSNANISVETENASSSPQLKSKSPSTNLLETDVNTSVGTENDVVSSLQLDMKSSTKISSDADANKSIGKENEVISSPQMGVKTPVKSLKPKTDSSFESETMNKLQHSQVAATDRASPLLNVIKRTPLKKPVSQINSCTPTRAADTSAATEKSILEITPMKDHETTIAKKGLQSGSPSFSRFWSQSVAGKAVDFIDGLSRQKEPEEEVIKSTNVSVSSRKSNKSFDNTFDDEEEVDDVKKVVDGFINDEAEEAEEDDDSMDEEEKQYIRDNEIPERDISLGSNDSLADDADGSVSSMDSFIVSDSDDLSLLNGTGDDLSLEPPVEVKPLRKSHRIVDTSDEEQVNTQISVTYTHTRTVTNDNRKSKNMKLDKGAAIAADKFDISIDKRPPKSGMSKSFVEHTTFKKTTKLNKSVGEECNENPNFSGMGNDSFSSNQLNESVVSNKSSDNSVDKTSVASPSKATTKAGLSKSLVEPAVTKKDLKLNKSASTNKLNDSVGERRSSFKVDKDEIQGLRQLEHSADDVNTSSGADQIERVNSAGPQNKRKRSIKTTDGEIESTPLFAKSPITSVKKKPTYDEIMGRCDSIIKKALDAKLEQKLQNKNPIADDKIQKLKSKKEQKQLAKARRAAALIEIQNQAVEKAEKKRLKKEARALKHSEIPEDDKAEAVAKALNHGIALLSKKIHKSLPIDDLSVVPDEPVQVKTKKRKINTIDEEVAAKSYYKSIDHSNAVIKQGQAKRKQEPPAQDIDAEPVSHGTLKKRKLPQLINEPSSDLSMSISKNAKATLIEPFDDVNIAPPKKMKKLNPSQSNSENDSIPTTIASTKQKKKKLNILLTKPENNSKPLVVAKPKAFDSNVLKITPKPAGFKEHSKSSAVVKDTKPKQKKKKEIVERVTIPPKPQWTASGAFEVSALPNNTGTNDIMRFSSSTDFVVASLAPKHNKVKSSASEFKQRATFNDNVKRESSKQLLQRKEKQMVYTRF